MLLKSDWLSSQKNSQKSIGSHTKIGSKPIAYLILKKTLGQEGKDKCIGNVRGVEREGDNALEDIGEVFVG